jgi:hypothetical protein
LESKGWGVWGVGVFGLEMFGFEGSREIQQYLSLPDEFNQPLLLQVEVEGGICLEDLWVEVIDALHRRVHVALLDC